MTTKTPPPPFEPATETWSFGELFDLELPIDCRVRHLEGAVEIGARTQHGRAHLAVLDVATGQAPEEAARQVLARFAATRGLEEALDVVVLTGPDGVAQARAALSDASGSWRIGAAAFRRHVILVTTWVPERGRGLDPAGGRSLLALTDQLLGSIRVRRGPPAVALPPDPPGAF